MCCTDLIVCFRFYLVQFGLLTGEREGEPYWKFLLFNVVLFYEVTQAFGHMVKQLERRRTKIRHKLAGPRSKTPS